MPTIKDPVILHIMDQVKGLVPGDQPFYAEIPENAIPEILTINGAHALGYLLDPRGDFVVRVGSVVSPTTTEAFERSSYARRRRLMVERGFIRDGVMTQDEIFESRHYAACVIGGDIRGAQAWRRPTAGKTAEQKEREYGDSIPEETEDYEPTYRNGTLKNECW